MTALLQATGLSVARGSRTIVHAVDLALGAGEGVALIGPNAAGKSTLLRGLAGLLPAAQGEVRLDGQPLRQWNRDALARSVALVSAEEGAASPLTVGDRVALGRYPHRGPFRALDASDARAIERAMSLTGIEALAHRPLHQLSAGERQLAALARGLAQEPRLLLLDEPAAHLDVGHELRLFEILDGVRRDGVAVLAVVHDLQRAADWASRMILLHQGRVAADGAPEVVMGSEAVAKAFDVAVRVHKSGASRPFYSFDPPAATSAGEAPPPRR